MKPFSLSKPFLLNENWYKNIRFLLCILFIAILLISIQGLYQKEGFIVDDITDAIQKISQREKEGLTCTEKNPYMLVYTNGNYECFPNCPDQSIWKDKKIKSCGGVDA